MSYIQRKRSDKSRSVRGRRLGVLAVCICVGGLLTQVGSPAAAQSPRSARASAAATVPPVIKSYAKYADAKLGKANPKLAPVVIGFATNGGGSITPLSDQTVAAAQGGVTLINKYLGGVDGHPLQLSVCYVKNSEEEGAGCADQFVNNSKVVAIAYGSLAVGADTIDNVVAGKKPIIIPLSFSGNDATAKNAYVLFPTGQLAFNTVGTFLKTGLHAKTAAIIYPQSAGEQSLAGSIKAGSVGIDAKVVGFNPTTLNVLGAMTAAGAQHADAVVGVALTTPANCEAFYKAASELGISQSKLVSFTDCLSPTMRSQYPGGDFPKGWYQIAEAGDNIIQNAVGKQYKAALQMLGAASHLSDPWWVSGISSMLTIDQFLNHIGYRHITPATVTQEAKKFNGPLLYGPPVVQCRKYSKLPNDCGDGASSSTTWVMGSTCATRSTSSRCRAWQRHMGFGRASSPRPKRLKR